MQIISMILSLCILLVFLPLLRKFNLDNALTEFLIVFGVNFAIVCLLDNTFASMIYWISNAYMSFVFALVVVLCHFALFGSAQRHNPANS